MIVFVNIYQGKADGCLKEWLERHVMRLAVYYNNLISYGVVN
jgi:hypothetical protein